MDHESEWWLPAGPSPTPRKPRSPPAQVIAAHLLRRLSSPNLPAPRPASAISFVPDYPATPSSPRRPNPAYTPARPARPAEKVFEPRVTIMERQSQLIADHKELQEHREECVRRELLRQQKRARAIYRASARAAEHRRRQLQECITRPPAPAKRQRRPPQAVDHSNTLERPPPCDPELEELLSTTRRLKLEAQARAVEVLAVENEQLLLRRIWIRWRTAPRTIAAATAAVLCVVAAEQACLKVWDSVNHFKRIVREMQRRVMGLDLLYAVVLKAGKASAPCLAHLLERLLGVSCPAPPALPSPPSPVLPTTTPSMGPWSSLPSSTNPSPQCRQAGRGGRSRHPQKVRQMPRSSASSPVRCENHRPPRTPRKPRGDRGKTREAKRGVCEGTVETMEDREFAVIHLVMKSSHRGLCPRVFAEVVPRGGVRPYSAPPGRPTRSARERLHPVGSLDPPQCTHTLVGLLRSVHTRGPHVGSYLFQLKELSDVPKRRWLHNFSWTDEEIDAFRAEIRAAAWVRRVERNTTDPKVLRALHQMKHTADRQLLARHLLPFMRAIEKRLNNLRERRERAEALMRDSQLALLRRGWDKWTKVTSLCICLRGNTRGLVPRYWNTWAAYTRIRRIERRRSYAYNEVSMRTTNRILFQRVFSWAFWGISSAERLQRAALAAERFDEILRMGPKIPSRWRRVGEDILLRKISKRLYCHAQAHAHGARLIRSFLLRYFRMLRDWPHMKKMRHEEAQKKREMRKMIIRTGRNTYVEAGMKKLRTAMEHNMLMYYYMALRRKAGFDTELPGGIVSDKPVDQLCRCHGLAWFLCKGAETVDEVCDG